MHAHRARQVLLAVCLATLGVASLPAQRGALPPSGPTGPGAPPAPRGTAPPAVTGTGAISGVVIDGTTKQPLAGAIVEAFGVLPGARGSTSQPRVITDSKGRFVFRSLVALQTGYAITATKFGYVPETGGPRLPDPLQPQGTPLGEGEWTADVSVVLWRLSSISGRVVDEAGEPLVDIPVRVLTRVPTAGVMHLAAGPVTKTDDRGVYRLSGLPRGSYIVSVPSVQSAVPASTPSVTVSGTTAEALQRQEALTANQLLRGTVAANTMGIDVGPSRIIVGNYATPPPVRGRAQAYPVLFYPNARSATRANPVDLAYGEERQGIDFVVQPVSTVRLSGRVTGPAGAAAGMVLRLLPDGSEDLGVGSEQATSLVEPDGRFTFLSVPAGSYTIEARRTVTELIRGTPIMVGLPATPGMVSGNGTGSSIASAPTGTLISTRHTTGDDAYWGRLQVDVGADDQSNLVVALRPTATISGQFVFEGTTPPRTFPRASAEPATGRAGASVSTLIRLDPATGRPVPTAPTSPGAFSLQGLKDGDYFLRADRSPPIVVKSVVINGMDYTDRPFAASGGDITGVIVTLTDKSASVSGRVRDRRGAAVTKGAVVAFPVDQTQWTRFGFDPPRIKAVTFSAATGYTIAALPQGDYYLIAVEASQFEAWQDPRFFAAAASSAARISLDWGATKTQDLTLVEVLLK